MLEESSWIDVLGQQGCRMLMHLQATRSGGPRLRELGSVKGNRRGAEFQHTQSFALHAKCRISSCLETIKNEFLRKMDFGEVIFWTLCG